MTEVFLEYGKISLWMLPLIGGALLLLPKLSGRYGARLPDLVWLILAVRLVLPVSISLPEEQAPFQVPIDQVALEQPLFPKETPVAEQTEAPTAMTEEPSFSVTPLQGMTVVWLAGTAFCLLRFSLASFTLKRLLRRWEKEPSTKTLTFYAGLAGEQAPKLRLCPVVHSPMAEGLFAPKIYLPHEDYSEAELEMILRHELIHWRRRDLWYKLLLVLVRSIHWFNPLVWLMVKRASWDMEISCDGKTVEGRDMAYRKAYSQMILQEMERGIFLRQGLTTCFAGGTKAWKERLVEILNGEKRKKGGAVVALALALSLTAGSLMTYAEEPRELAAKPAAADPTQYTKKEKEQYKMAKTWADALSLHKGKIRYDMMGEAQKARFIEEQKSYQGEDWDYFIGGSSPWVDAYEIEVKGEKATITYRMMDSTPTYYEMIELLKFGKENGKTVVTNANCSLLRLNGHTVGYVYGKSGEELDEQTWDFLHRTVIDTIFQSEYGQCEYEAFRFDIQKAEKRTDPATGRKEISVEFDVERTYRNPFKDPDEVGYIKRAKLAGSKEYETLYREYNEQKQDTFPLKLVYQMQGDAYVQDTVQLYWLTETGHDQYEWLPAFAEELKKALNNSVPTGSPVDSTKISMGFGVRNHTGIDLPTEKSVPVRATADAFVLEARYDKEKGNYVLLNHGNGFTTLYAHLADLQVSEGQRVQKGNTLGMSGSTGMATGIHCHYEVTLNGILQNPQNYI